MLWTPSESGAGLQGLVGVHLVIANIGRIHIFGPPGVMLVTQNTSTGKMVRVASTWGTSIYLVDFRLPGSSHTGRLFVNLGKAWMNGDHRNGINMRRPLRHLEKVSSRFRVLVQGSAFRVTSLCSAFC